MHDSVDYWIARTARADEVLADTARIVALCDETFARDPHMVELAAHPPVLSANDTAELIRTISKRYEAPLYHRDSGQPLSDTDYAHYESSLNLHALTDSVTVRFALVLRRADMRAWPTDDFVYKTPETIELDRFQENGLFPAEVVAVLHESADGLWYFVRSYNYAAWVRKDRVVTGDRDEIFRYRDASPFVVITGGKVELAGSRNAGDAASVQLDMGVRLPLATAVEPGRDAGYPVRLPVRGRDGELTFRTALIESSQDVHVGYLPYTRKQILLQTFKFLGERYGWGHSYNARDCTGLVIEVFRCFGIVMPRNSGQQGSSPVGNFVRFAAGTAAAEKLQAMASAEVGDLVYSSGHVMLYVGTADDEPYVIHDMSGSGFPRVRGEAPRYVVRGVAVTPLTQVRSSPDTLYFEQVYAIKRLR
jgi:cell wall-associated NlpC family hydrolase